MKVKICRLCLSRGITAFDPPVLLEPKEELHFKMDKDFNLLTLEKGFPGNMVPIEFEISLCRTCRS